MMTYSPLGCARRVVKSIAVFFTTLWELIMISSEDRRERRERKQTADEFQLNYAAWIKASRERHGGY